MRERPASGVRPSSGITTSQTRAPFTESMGATQDSAETHLVKGRWIPAVRQVIGGALAGIFAMLTINGCANDRGAPSALQMSRGTELAQFPLMNTPVEGLPRIVQAAVGMSSQRPQWAASQAVPAPFAIPRVWAVSDNEQICLLSLESNDGVGVTCKSVRDALLRGVAITLLRSAEERQRERIIVGIAPKGISAVRAIVTSGGATYIPVRDGAFATVDFVSKPPDRLELLSDRVPEDGR